MSAPPTNLTARLQDAPVSNDEFDPHAALEDLLGDADVFFANRRPGYLARHGLDAITADTPLGRYRGVTEQVRMSQTPGYYTNPLVPRGSQRPLWHTQGA